MELFDNAKELKKFITEQLEIFEEDLGEKLIRNSFGEELQLYLVMAENKIEIE